MRWIALLLIALPGVGHAEPPCWWDQRRYELDGGITTTTFARGDAQVQTRGATVGAGVRWARRSLHLDYGLGLRGPEASGAAGGTSHELSLRFRRGLGVIGGSEWAHGRVDVWLEAGVGGRFDLGYDGRHDQRPLVSVGIGGTAARLTSDDDDRARRYLGLRVAVRVLALPTDVDGALARCVGPCAPIRDGAPLELGVMLSGTLMVGR